MEKQVLLLFLLLPLASAALWQDGWHDSSGGLFRFRRSILVHHPVASEASGPAEINLTFSGVYPYCDDANLDGDLNDAGDSLALRAARMWSNGSIGDVAFQVENWTDLGCVSNQLLNATLRFQANFSHSSEDRGFGEGNTLYRIYHETDDRFSQADGSLASQTETAELLVGAEERLWQGEWEDWNGNLFSHRARLHLENSSWRFSEGVSASLDFHGNLYCYDVDGDDDVDEDDLLALRAVREDDGLFVELPLNFSGGCSEEVERASVSLVSDLPAGSCEKGLFLYYTPTGLNAPDFPPVSPNATSSATRGREVPRGETAYCGNFVCEDGEDLCACPNDCCPAERNGACFSLCFSSDPDCCEDCWSSRYLCDGGRGGDCYPGRCDAGACVSACSSQDDCSSGFCYNLTASKECFPFPAPEGTLLSFDDGTACEGDYDSSTLTCSDVCVDVTDNGYYEYDGSDLIMTFEVENNCAMVKTPAVSLHGPLAFHTLLSSPHYSWDGTRLELTPGSSAEVVATLSDVPSDLVGVHELKLSARYGNDTAGSSPQVVVFPNVAYLFGREVPPFVQIGRADYVSSSGGVPVRVEVTVW